MISVFESFLSSITVVKLALAISNGAFRSTALYVHKLFAVAAVVPDVRVELRNCKLDCSEVEVKLELSTDWPGEPAGAACRRLSLVTSYHLSLHY